MDWNFTLEKEVMANTVVRAAYVGNHGSNQQMYVGYNDSTPAYIWYATKKTALPTGEFASVATRPYDQTVYGTINMFSSIGWSNHTSFQLELERRYHKGLAFQVFYRAAKTLLTNRDTDGTQSGETIHSLNFYMPGAVPTDMHDLNKFLNYRLDPNTPRHQIQWNFIADLPLGRGKKFGAHMNRVADKVVGGWQIAGLGRWRTNYFALPTTYYQTDKNIELYGYKYPIQDCTSGACYPGYLFWNGYIPANRINSVDANGKPNGIEGVPSNYKPATQPLIPWGQTALPAKHSGRNESHAVLGHQHRMASPKQRQGAAHYLSGQLTSLAKPIPARTQPMVPGRFVVQVRELHRKGRLAVCRRLL